VQDTFSSTDTADRNTFTALPSAVLDSYYTLSTGTYTSSANSLSYTGPAPTSTAYTFAGDTQLIKFKGNTYTKNLGSGGQGLVDIRGATRVWIESETFTGNGDAQKYVTSKT